MSFNIDNNTACKNQQQSEQYDCLEVDIETNPLERILAQSKSLPIFYPGSQAQIPIKLDSSSTGQSPLEQTAKKQACLKSRKVDKSKVVQIQKELVDKFINQNSRLKGTINDLKGITLKLKKNEEIFREGRAINKSKIQRLLQEVERKKAKLHEKDIAIEQLSFDVEKLELKVRALEKYQDLHSPVFMSLTKKDLTKNLSLIQGVFEVTLELPIIQSDKLHSRRQVSQSKNSVSNQKQLDNDAKTPLKAQLQRSVQQLHLESNPKPQSKRCHQCDIYFEQNRQLKLKLLNHSSQNLQQQILRLQSLEAEHLKTIALQGQKIAKHQSIIQQQSLHLQNYQKLQLQDQHYLPPSSSQLERQLAEAMTDNKILTQDLLNLQEHSQNIFIAKQQLQDKLQSLIPELEAEVESLKAKSFEDDQTISKLKNQLMHEKAVHNDVENMLRDQIHKRDQNLIEMNESYLEKERELSDLKHELITVEEQSKSQELQIRMLERQRARLKDEITQLRQRMEQVEQQKAQQSQLLKLELIELQAKCNSNINKQSFKSAIIQTQIYEQANNQENSPHFHQYKNSSSEPLSSCFAPSTQLQIANQRIIQLQQQNKHLSEQLEAAQQIFHHSRHRLSLEPNTSLKQMKLLSDDIQSKKDLCDAQQYPLESKRTIRSDSEPQQISLEHIDSSHNHLQLSNSQISHHANPIPSNPHQHQLLQLQKQLQQLSRQHIVEKTHRIELQGQNDALKLILQQKTHLIYELNSQLQQTQTLQDRQYIAKLETQLRFLNDEKQALLNTILSITENIAHINNSRSTAQIHSIKLIQDHKLISGHQLISDHQFISGNVPQIHLQNHTKTHQFNDSLSSNANDQNYTELPSLIKSIRAQISTSLSSVKKLTHAFHSKKQLLPSKQVPSAFAQIHKRKLSNNHELVNLQSKECSKHQDRINSDLSEEKALIQTIEQIQNREQSFKQLIRSVNKLEQGVKIAVINSQKQVQTGPLIEERSSEFMQVREDDNELKNKGWSMIQDLIQLSDEKKQIICLISNSKELNKVKQINDDLRKLMQEVTADFEEESEQKDNSPEGQISNNQQNLQNLEHRSNSDSSISMQTWNQPQRLRSQSQQNEYIGLINQLERQLNEIKEQFRSKAGLEEENRLLKNQVYNLNAKIQELNEKIKELTTGDKPLLTDSNQPLNPVDEEQEYEEEVAKNIIKNYHQKEQINEHENERKIDQNNESLTSLEQVHSANKPASENFHTNDLHDKLSEESSVLQCLNMIIEVSSKISTYVQTYEQLSPQSLATDESLIETLLANLVSCNVYSLSSINSMYLAVKYRLKLLKKLESQKYLHLQTQQKQIYELKRQIEKKQQVIQAQKDKIQHMKLCESKNQQMLIENIQLHKTVTELKQIIQKLKQKYSHTQPQSTKYPLNATKILNKPLAIASDTVRQSVHYQPNQHIIEKQAHSKTAEYFINQLQHTNRSQMSKLNLSDSVIDPAPNEQFLSREQLKLNKSAESMLTLEFMKQLLAEVESIEENVIRIQTDMQNNYKLLKYFAKKKNLLLSPKTSLSLSQMNTPSNQLIPSHHKHLLTSPNNQAKSLTSLLQRGKVNSFESCQSSMMVSEYSKMVKELQVKLQENEKQMEVQKVRIQQQFSSLMKDILLLEDNQHISRDKFKMYLERIKTATDRNQPQILYEVQENQYKSENPFKSDNPSKSDNPFNQKIQPSVNEGQQYTTDRQILKNIMNQLEGIVAQKSQYNFQIDNLTRQQTLSASVEMYISTKSLAHEKWLNFNSAIEYESQQSIIEDENESESESQPKQLSSYTQSEPRNPSSYSQSEPKSSSGYTESLAKDPNSQSPSAIKLHSPDQPQQNHLSAHSRIHPYDQQPSAHSRIHPYDPQPTDNYQLSTKPQFTHPLFQSSPQQMCHSVELMQVSLNQQSPYPQFQ